MTKLLKEHATGEITTQIQVLTIVTSFLVDYLFNEQTLSNRQTIGVFLMICGILLSSKKRL
jgi:drug/metabolite transporter (DMT)-like permease